MPKKPQSAEEMHAIFKQFAAAQNTSNIQKLAATLGKNPLSVGERQSLVLKHRGIPPSEFDGLDRIIQQEHVAAALKAEMATRDGGAQSLVGDLAGGVSLGDATALIDAELADAIKARLQKSKLYRDVLRPKNLGTCPLHKQVKLFRPFAIFDFLEKSNEPMPMTKEQFIRNLSNKMRQPVTSAKK